VRNCSLAICEIEQTGEQCVSFVRQAASSVSATSQGAGNELILKAYPRERFWSEVTLTPAVVGAYARAAGDDNPIHHDPQYALSTRYGRVIASGTHTTALLLGLTASHFSKVGAMVGLEFWVRFRRPIYADETIRMEWLVIKVTPNEKLNGEIIDLRGRIKAQDGQTALGARGRVLVTDRL
jgi:Acyl dehydratase